MYLLKLIAFLCIFQATIAQQQEVKNNDTVEKMSSTIAVDSSASNAKGMFESEIEALERELKTSGGSRPSGSRPNAPSTPVSKPASQPITPSIAYPTNPSFPTPTPPTGMNDPNANYPSPTNPTLTNPTNPTLNRNPTTAVCNNNSFCSGSENCQNCPRDCKKHARTCGDGKCVEGENCQNCPADCSGNTNQPEGSPEIAPEDLYCCGFGDGINPNGCGDYRCTSNGYKCFETTCEGLNSRNSNGGGGLLLSGGYVWRVGVGAGLILCLFF